MLSDEVNMWGYGNCQEDEGESVGGISIVCHINSEIRSECIVCRPMYYELHKTMTTLEYTHKR